ncbi:Twinfilin-1 [Pleosporales sp. CAS-2024a]
MEDTSNSFCLSAAVHKAFAGFVADQSLLALPIAATDDGSLQPLPAVRSHVMQDSLQVVLNQLEAVIDARTPLYLLLRRDDRLIAITFVPYLAKEHVRSFYLHHRHDFVKELGEKHFSQSLICKEVCEITDARSWAERDGAASPRSVAVDHADASSLCQNGGCREKVQDIGYQRNRCRLCDQRMKNKIASEAVQALKTLRTPGTMIQVCVDTSTETLNLKLSQQEAHPENVSRFLPLTTPSFTFYHHPVTNMVYLIFHSPDIATVQQRMQSTMAIPGLLVHAEDAGIRVDQKIEIHDPSDVEFESVRDARAGRFRSMYRREGYNGTELVYKGMARDKAFLDSV